MKIEVTEKEALEILSQRHWKSRGKIKYLPLLILVVALGLSMFIYTYGQWLSVAVLVILATPVLIVSWKSARKSGKYIHKQVEQLK